MDGQRKSGIYTHNSVLLSHEKVKFCHLYNMSGLEDICEARDRMTTGACSHTWMLTRPSQNRLWSRGYQRPQKAVEMGVKRGLLAGTLV